MLSLSVITLTLATIGAYAKPTVRAVGGLEISLSTPTDKVASVSDLRIIATVKNVGDEDLKVLKHGTVLDNELPTRSFIVSKDGKEAPFTGVTISISTDHLSENHWVVIPAGKTVTAEHSVSTVYDFSTTGPGTFTFDPVSRFQAIELNNPASTIGAARINVATTHSVTVTVTNDVSKREAKREVGLGKRDQIVCSDPDKASFIADSIKDAGYLNIIASVYMDSRGPDDPLYKAYFGSNPISDVMSSFNLIGDISKVPITMDCSDPYDTCSRAIAYTHHEDKTIYFCSGFFELKSPQSLCKGNTVNKRNLRGGVAIHELSHALELAHDLKYGCPESQGLPDQDKIQNADNFECYVAQAFHDYRCS